jgi:hypothetical protein
MYSSTVEAEAGSPGALAWSTSAVPPAGEMPAARAAFFIGHVTTGKPGWSSAISVSRSSSVAFVNRSARLPSRESTSEPTVAAARSTSTTPLGSSASPGTSTIASCLASRRTA